MVAATEEVVGGITGDILTGKGMVTTVDMDMVIMVDMDTDMVGGVILIGEVIPTGGVTVTVGAILTGGVTLIGGAALIITPIYGPYYYEGEPPPPEEVIPPAELGRPQPSYWYFCQNPEGYYPYVKNCPSGWMRVVPSKPNAAPPATLGAPVLPIVASASTLPSPKVIDKMTLHIVFDFDKATLTEADLKELPKAVAFVRKYPGCDIRLDEYTDNIGTDAYNIKLSEKRAIAIKNYFIKEGGVDRSKITAVGHGKADPVADNKTTEGRAIG